MADTNDGDERLHKHMTKEAEGLEKWVHSEHPWTALHRQLVKYLGPEQAKQRANEWHHELFGTGQREETR